MMNASEENIIDVLERRSQEDAIFPQWLTERAIPKQLQDEALITALAPHLRLDASPQFLVMALSVLVSSLRDVDMNSAFVEATRDEHTLGNFLAARRDKHTIRAMLEQILAETKRSRFQYEPLDKSKSTIRLLQVLPASTFWPTSNVVCIIREFSLEQPPKYITLSYTWDRVPSPQDIICNGELLAVGRNLFEFLQWFQQVEHSSRFIWIDAICIDQTNIPERNHQVTKMRHIYSQASLGITWLGKDAKLEEACTTIKRDSREDMPQSMYVRHHILSNIGDDVGGEAIRVSYRNLMDPKLISAIHYFAETPRYWTRAWIIQEFLLPERVEVWCGKTRLGPEVLDTLLSHTLAHETPARTLCRQRALVDTGKQEKANFKFVRLLNNLKFAQCSVLHDRIYAFLGIASDLDNRERQMAIDYSKTTRELFLDVLPIICTGDPSLPYHEITSAIGTVLTALELDNVSDKIEIMMKVMEKAGFGELPILVELLSLDDEEGIAAIRTKLEGLQRTKLSGEQ